MMVLSLGASATAFIVGSFLLLTAMHSVGIL